MPVCLVEGTEDLATMLAARVDFACPICEEAGNHVCVQGFQILLELDETFASAVAKLYYQLKYAGMLQTSIEEIASQLEDAEQEQGEEPEDSSDE